MTVEPLAENPVYVEAIEPRFVTVNAAPPNKWMELTVKSVVPFAKRRAKVTPPFPAAHAWR
jgi:hypothetical protein